MWRRKRTAADFSAEIQAHIELEAERLCRQGLPEEQARYAARRSFGNVTHAQERFHERGRWLWWDRLRQDVHFGAHLLARSPGFTVVAFLTLALGIGAVTVIFSAVYAVLLKPLPFASSQTLARRYWPGENPIGKQLRVPSSQQIGPWLSVVGVAADVHTDGPSEAPRPELYLPYPQFPWVLNPHDLVVRTQGLPTDVSVIREVVQTVHGVDPDQPVADITTLGQIVHDATVTQRATMALMVSLAVLALILAAVGIYSVLSYSVAQQAHEIGLRVALGARPGAVAWLVAGTTLRLAAIGMLIGAAAAWPLSALMKNLLFGVHAGDPMTLTAVIGILIGTSAIAAYLPARRAINANPIVVLRSG